MAGLCLTWIRLFSELFSLPGASCCSLCLFTPSTSDFLIELKLHRYIVNLSTPTAP